MLLPTAIPLIKQLNHDHRADVNKGYVKQWTNGRRRSPSLVVNLQFLKCYPPPQNTALLINDQTICSEILQECAKMISLKYSIAKLCKKWLSFSVAARNN